MVMGKSLSDRGVGDAFCLCEAALSLCAGDRDADEYGAAYQLQGKYQFLSFSDGNSGEGYLTYRGRSILSGGGLCVYQLPEPVCPRKYGGASVDFDVGAF